MTANGDSPTTTVKTVAQVKDAVKEVTRNLGGPIDQTLMHIDVYAE